MTNMGKRKSKQCPECGSDNVMPIIYGLIDDPEAIKQIENITNKKIWLSREK